jgi:hypothetical protein
MLLELFDGLMGRRTVGAVLAGEVNEKHTALRSYVRSLDITVILLHVVAGSEEQSAHGNRRSPIFDVSEIHFLFSLEIVGV